MSKPALTIQDLCKRFHTTEVLSHLSLTVAAGEVVVLIGPNGSGKSTLLGSLGGIVIPDAGTIEIGGIDLAAAPLAARRHLRYLAQELLPPTGLCGREWLAFHAEVFAATPPQRHQMEKFADLGVQLDHLITTYSLGMRRRLALAGLMAGPAQLFVLDEPFAGVDPDHQARWVEELTRRVTDGAGVLLAAHAADERAVVSLEKRVPTRIVELESLQTRASA